MIKVLGLALYGASAASHRQRLSQYADGLATLGIALQINPLLGNEYLHWRFQGGGMPIGTLLRDAWQRLAMLQDRDAYDVALLYCELFPLLPAWVEQPLLSRPYIYDLDDAFYLKYRSGKLALTQPLLGAKVDALMAGAAAVTAGSQVLAQYARRFNPRTHHLPTVVDTTRYVPQRPGGPGEALKVGWIGSPSTEHYLRMLVEPLSRLGEEGRVQLLVIGGKAPPVPHVEVIELPWREDTEVELINTLDIGIMPLHDNPWSRGKCAFKLIQYMACGVPVVASPVGANVDVVTPDCGFLASDTPQWLDSLRRLRDETALRQRMGEAARERVLQHYSLHQTLPLLADVIHQVAKRG